MPSSIWSKLSTYSSMCIVLLCIGHSGLALGDPDDDAYLKEKRKTLEKNIEDGKKQRAAEKEENRKRLEKRMEEARQAREAEKQAAADARRRRDEERRAVEEDEAEDEESESETGGDDEPISDSSGDSSGADESGSSGSGASGASSGAAGSSSDNSGSTGGSSASGGKGTTSSASGGSSGSAADASGSDQGDPNAAGNSPTESRAAQENATADSEDQPADAGSGFYVGDTPTGAGQRSGNKIPGASEKPPERLPPSAGAGAYNPGAGAQAESNQNAPTNSEGRAGLNSSSLSSSDAAPAASAPRPISQHLPESAVSTSSAIPRTVPVTPPPLPQAPANIPDGAAGALIRGQGSQVEGNQNLPQSSPGRAGSASPSLSSDEAAPRPVSQSAPDIAGGSASPASQTVPVSSPRLPQSPARTATAGGEDRQPADAVGIVVPDVEIYPIRWTADGYPTTTSGQYLENGRVFLIRECSWALELNVGYTLHLGPDTTEDRMADYPISGSMRQGGTIVASINEIPYFHGGRRTTPTRRLRQIAEPHGFGYVRVPVEVGFGEHTFTMIVDEFDSIQERDETNNITTARFSVQPHPDVDLACAPTSIAASSVVQGSRAAGSAADLPTTPAGLIPDENTQRGVLSQANLVIEIDTPMSPAITIRNTGRTATDASATLQISCSSTRGEACPSASFAAELAAGAVVPPLEPGASYLHMIDAWPRDILWPTGTFNFEARVNGNNAVAESPNNNVATSTMTWNHSTDTIAEHCLGCHEPGGRGFGPPPDELAERESEVGIDVLVQNAVNGYRGMPPKGQVEWLSEAQVREVLLHLIEL